MPRRKRAEQRTRLHVDLPISVKERMEHVRVATGAESLGEVIRRAFALYEMVVTEAPGKKLIFRDSAGHEEIFRVI